MAGSMGFEYTLNHLSKNFKSQPLTYKSYEQYFSRSLIGCLRFFLVSAKYITTGEGLCLVSVVVVKIKSFSLKLQLLCATIHLSPASCLQAFLEQFAAV